jgi:hypothetical protein
MHNAQGKIGKDEAPLFEALRKDCQWIIDQIDALEKNTFNQENHWGNI